MARHGRPRGGERVESALAGYPAPDPYCKLHTSPETRRPGVQERPCSRHGRLPFSSWMWALELAHAPSAREPG